MKFKHNLLLLLSLSLGFVSCNLDTDDDDNVWTETYQNVCNLVIPTSGEVTATPGGYALSYYNMSGNLTVAASNLSFGTGSSSFLSNPFPYTSAAYGENPGPYYVVNRFKGGQATGGGLTVTNITGFTTQAVNTVPSTMPPMPGYAYSFPTAVVLSYNVNSQYTVKTFPGQAVYSGNTTVATVGAPMEPFTNPSTLYMVVLKDNLKKADVIFHGAKFAQMMPDGIHFVIKDLDVTYSKNGYTISIPEGNEYIYPLMPEGQTGEYTPYESYRFTKFEFSQSNDELTGGVASYTIQNIRNQQVAATFNCTFTGSYIFAGSNL